MRQYEKQESFISNQISDVSYYCDLYWENLDTVILSQASTDYMM